MTTPDSDPAALNSAAGTELFVLQAIANSTISEAGTRSAIYLSTLSSGLVAMGFAGNSPALLAALAYTALPTIFMLGWFTVVRLVDNRADRRELGNTHISGRCGTGTARRAAGLSQTDALPGQCI